MREIHEARAHVQAMLDLVNGDADLVHAALAKAARTSRQSEHWTSEHEESYRMQRLALADITGIAHYRHH